MAWDAYTTFSVLTGAMLLGLAAIPLDMPKERLTSLLGGLFLIGYGLYVGHATSGTYPFPVWIFVAPFVMLLIVGAGVYERWIAPRLGATSTASAPEPAPVPVPVPGSGPESASAAPAAAVPPASVDRHAPDFGLDTAFSPGAVRSSPDPSRPHLYGNVERP